jgi:hypothetical protein
MERIPENKNASAPQEQTVNNYYVTEKQRKSPAEVVDFAMGSIFVILIIAIIATYFVTFNVDIMVSIKKITWQAFWVWLASFCVGELAKKIFRRKGQKTENYQEAENDAKSAIKELNESEYADRAEDYCKYVTKSTIDRYRTHQLVTVGITLNTFEELYLGKGTSFLFKKILRKELSFLQARAINRCNHIKTKVYDPRFITSYAIEDNSALTPQQWYNTQAAEKKDFFFSIVFSAGASFGVCGIFYDFLLEFSTMALFLAIVKIIVMATTCALKANVGWNLSIMEIGRNMTRASEAKACISWAEKNPKISQLTEKE